MAKKIPIPIVEQTKTTTEMQKNWREFKGRTLGGLMGVASDKSGYRHNIRSKILACEGKYRPNGYNIVFILGDIYPYLSSA